MSDVIGFWAKTVYCRDCRKPGIVNGYSPVLFWRCESCAGDAARREAKERQEKESEAMRDEIVDALKEPRHGNHS